MAIGEKVAHGRKLMAISSQLVESDGSHRFLSIRPRTAVHRCLRASDVPSSHRTESRWSVTMKVFLSAVTAEFEACRNALASDLRAIGCEVKVQEDFKQGESTLLKTLENYIVSCDLVIALIGWAYGWPAKGATDPKKTPPRSCTQWEYHLALGERLNGSPANPKPTLIYLASDRFPTNVGQSPDSVELQLQRDFRTTVQDSGEHWSSFDDLNHICRLVLRDLRNRLTHEKRWREIARVWLQQLILLSKEIGLSETQRAAILRHVGGASLATPPNDEDVVDILATDPDARRRAMIDGPADDRPVLGDAVSIRHRQVLYALAMNEPVRRNVLGIPFVLVPPGIAPDGSKNLAAFYVSESLVSESEWSSLAGEPIDERADASRAKTGLSLEDVKALLCGLRLRMPRTRFDIPTGAQWRFLVGLGGSSQPPTRSPHLRLGTPSPLGIWDLRGVAWQFVRESADRYVLRGGSFRDRADRQIVDPEPIPCLNSEQRCDEAGLRLVIALSPETR